MVWSCTVVTYEEGMRPGIELKVGSMFFVPENPSTTLIFLTRGLSPYYKEHNYGRRPTVIVLPEPMFFCIDTMAWTAGNFYGTGWTVSGLAPDITLSPSINIGGTYHGFLQNGIISDDCEGRTYDLNGYPIVGDANG